MTNLPAAIVMGSVFIAVGLFFGLKTVSDALYALWKLLHELHINVNHYTKTDSEAESLAIGLYADALRSLSGTARPG